MVIEQGLGTATSTASWAGTYDTTINWGTVGFNTVRSLLPHPGFRVGGLGGGQAESNYSRFSSPVVDGSVISVPGQQGDPQEQWQAIAAIQREVVTKVPYIPLTDRTHFNCYRPHHMWAGSPWIILTTAVEPGINRVPD